MKPRNYKLLIRSEIIQTSLLRPGGYEVSMLKGSLRFWCGSVQVGGEWGLVFKVETMGP